MEIIEYTFKGNSSTIMHHQIERLFRILGGPFWCSTSSLCWDKFNVVPFTMLPKHSAFFVKIKILFSSWTWMTVTKKRIDKLCTWKFWFHENCFILVINRKLSSILCWSSDRNSSVLTSLNIGVLRSLHEWIRLMCVCYQARTPMTYLLGNDSVQRISKLDAAFENVSSNEQVDFVAHQRRSAQPGGDLANLWMLLGVSGVNPHSMGLLRA